MKRLATIGIVFATMRLFGAPSVEITNVQQQYPWTNTVDITYTVSGITNKDYFVVFEAKDADSNLLGAQTNVLETSGAGQTAQWEPPFNIRKLNCTMTPYVYRGGQDDYMIVDLETWDVTFEGIVGSQEDANAKYTTNTVYKTSKMVFRKVEKGNYTIGCNDFTYDTQHSVAVPKDYYIAIFHCTVAQFDRINSGTKSTSMLPKDYISWITIRGSAGVTATPASGILATMNTKTGLAGFDLPTISMWEIAMRAGGTSKFITGTTTAGIGDYIWYSGNTSSMQEVGLKKANAWGIYDTIGPCWDVPLDIYNDGNLATLQPNALVPITSGDATRRFFVGPRIGFTSDGDNRLSPSYHASNAANNSAAQHGFRLAYIPAE